MFKNARQVTDKIAHSGRTFSITWVARCAHSADIDCDDPVVALRGAGLDVRSIRLLARSPDLKLVDLVLPCGPNTRPAVDEDENILCLLVHIYIVCRHDAVLGQGGELYSGPVPG